MENYSTNHVEVVFIEDSEEDADLAMRSFRKHNLANNIKLLDDGQEGLDYLFNEGEYAALSSPIQPKLVLLDLKLPKVSGLEILGRMRADNDLKRVPVVILTSSSEDKDIDCAYDLGANSYIVKPVNFAKFAETIHQLGFYWLVLNQSRNS